MTDKTFKKLFEQARGTDEYWLEGPILDFTEDLSRVMAEKKVSRSELARRIGASPAYVTKVLRGNVNFTLASMSKLARAFDFEVRLHLGPRETVTHWVDVPWLALSQQAASTEFKIERALKTHQAPAESILEQFVAVRSEAATTAASANEDRNAPTSAAA